MIGSSILAPNLKQSKASLILIVILHSSAVGSFLFQFLQEWEVSLVGQDYFQLLALFQFHDIQICSTLLFDISMSFAIISHDFPFFL
jgi:hypothetical protein